MRSVLTSLQACARLLGATILIACSTAGCRFAGDRIGDRAGRYVRRAAGFGGGDG